MKALSPEECSRYLAMVKSLRASYPLYDTHVHPYEVLFDRFIYDETAHPGVLSLTGKTYASPLANNFKFPEIGYFSEDPRSQRLQDISVMLLKNVYAFVGEQVFIDQMELSGIGQALLLPVASESGTPEQMHERLNWVKHYYRDEEKFWTAGSVPGSLEGSELRRYVGNLKAVHRIKAIKCHPVVTGIDLGAGSKKEWLEELLAACGAAELPIVIHGGRNNPYWGGGRGDFGALDHLSGINISSSCRPVILAHAGFHRCKSTEIEGDGLRVLDKMLQSHPNLYIDISGLTLEPLKLVIQNVDANRILFGSDALYASQWEAVILTMHALSESGMDPEKYFLQYASINPRKAIFEDQP